MIKVKVIGANGYGGVGICELLSTHPEAEIACLVDVADTGKRISDLYPHLKGFCDREVVAPDHPDAQQDVDIVFFSTPDGVGMKKAGAELERGARVIDYSGDFRFDTPEAYAEYAGRIKLNTVHASPVLLNETVYGIPELYRDKINQERKIVGNPGCFAISCILGLAPAVKAELIDLTSIICDCKTAVSGAGKKPHALFHYPARYDHMNTYKLDGHQHVCEIERELGLLAGTDVRVTFTSQVVPLCRGIMSTLYAQIKDPAKMDNIMEAYHRFHRGNMFVRIFDRNAAIGTIHVRCSNFCNLIVDCDERTNRLRVISHIDNLMKGQAGNALQNMNLMCGLPENHGLMQPPRYP